MTADMMAIFRRRLVCWASISWLVWMTAGMAGCAIGPRSTITILDSETGGPVPARVYLRNADGAEFVPDGAQVVRIGKSQRWFVSDGRLDVSQLAGSYDIRIERGSEYTPIKQTIEVIDGRTEDHTFRLYRWVNMAKLGYTSGENHLHVAAAELAPQLAAEGLDFGTSLQWWNGPRYDVPPGDGFVRDLQFAGVTVPTSIYDLEIEHSWGAVYIIGVPEALTADTDNKTPNLPIVRECHEDGALVCYQGGWSREVLLDALLGYVDVVNVCNNNFHRHQYQPRSRYSNLLDVEGFPEYAGTPEGMMRMNTDTYYRLLNCGLRLAAGAGSATGPKMTPVGYNRAYVRAGKKPTLPEFLEAWREGRNFVTNGPMLMLSVNKEARPGDTIDLSDGRMMVHVDAEVRSDLPIESLELVVNGQVVEMPTLPADLFRADITIPITEGSWIAARCTSVDMLLDEDELEANHHYGSEPMPRRPCRLRFAHTSPVYVTVNGKGACVEASIDEASRMLDAFERFAMKTARAEEHATLREVISKARTRLVVE